MLLTVLTMVYSKTTLDVVNNSLSILVLFNIHGMASKIFLMEVNGYYNQIYNRPDFIKFKVSTYDYKALNF